MSLNTKLGSIRRMVQELRKWPEDSHKIYGSFRDTQIGRFEDGLKGSQAKLPPAADIDAEISSVAALGGSKNMNLFPISTRLLEPQGMPTYYNRIVTEASRGSSKVSVFTAAKDTLFGWWK